MLETIDVIFDNMTEMMKKLKKDTYEKNMSNFRNKHGHYFEEMITLVEQSEDRDATVNEIANVFIESINSKFSVKGKMKPRTEADLTLFMIYYVFPALLLTESDYAVTIADSIRDAWRIRANNYKFQYTDYNKIYNSFRDKIFGIF